MNKILASQRLAEACENQHATIYAPELEPREVVACAIDAFHGSSLSVLCTHHPRGMHAERTHMEFFLSGSLDFAMEPLRAFQFVRAQMGIRPCLIHRAQHSYKSSNLQHTRIALNIAYGHFVQEVFTQVTERMHKNLKEALETENLEDQ